MTIEAGDDLTDLSWIHTKGGSVVLLAGGLEVGKAPAEDRAQGIGSAGPVDGLAVRMGRRSSYECHAQ